MVSNLISVRQDAQNPTRSRSDNVGKTPKPLVFEKRMSCFPFPNSSPFGKMTDLPITPSPKFSRTVRLELSTRRSRPGARYNSSSRQRTIFEIPTLGHSVTFESQTMGFLSGELPLAVAKCQQRQFCEQVVVNGSRVASSVFAKKHSQREIGYNYCCRPNHKFKKTRLLELHTCLLAQY